MGHHGGMPMDWTHLAHALRAARDELGLTQAELAERAGVSVKTVKNLENPDSSRTAWPRTLDDVERALEKPAGWARAEATADPTARRENPEETSDVVKTSGADLLASTGADLPPAFKLMLADGEVIDYSLVALPGEDEPSVLMAFVHPSTYETAESRAELRRRLIEFRRIAARVSRLDPELSHLDTPPDAQD